MTYRFDCFVLNELYCSAAINKAYLLILELTDEVTAQLDIYLSPL
jgi:hypothetical protein